MVTGGPAIVKIAMTTGKNLQDDRGRSGQPPVVVDETAIFPKCAEDIILGASFDNKRAVHRRKKKSLWSKLLKPVLGEYGARIPRAFELSASQMDAVTKLAIKKGGRGCKDPVMNRDYVGRDAAVIARGIGLDVPPPTRLFVGRGPKRPPLCLD